MTWVTGDQIVAHLIGDYLLQSHWMATEKVRRHTAAIVHALAYTVPFLLLTTSATALAVIALSHFIVDRWRLARFVVWAKNGARGSVTNTGYPESVPDWLAVWLLIIADNTIHLLCNAVALVLWAREGA